MSRTRPTKNNDPYQQLLVMNPSKGWNTLISNNLIDDKESPALTNIKFVEAGSPQKADGYSLTLTTTNNPRGMGYYNDMPNAVKYLLSVDGTALINVLNNTTIAGATFSSTGTITMTEVAGTMYIWDGVNGGAQLVTGGTLSRPGTMPKAKFSIYWNGVHCAAGVAGQESRLYITGAATFGAPNNPGQFTNTSGTLSTAGAVPGATVFSGTGAQYIDVQPNDSDQITGLSVFQNNLVIFKEHSIFQFSFDTSGNPVLQMITQAYGCVSFKSVVRVENDVFFLTRNGVYVLGYEPNYFAVIRTNELSARIHPLIETINPTNFNQATAVFNQYVYYLGLPTGGSTTNNLTVTYDRRYQAWSRWLHVMPESFVTYYDTNNNETIYFTSATTNQIFAITKNTYSANGAPISSSWTSKSFDLGNFNVFKRWIDCTIFFRAVQGSISVSFYTDNGTLLSTFGVANLSTIGIGSDLIGAFQFGGDTNTSAGATSPPTNNIPYRFRVSTKSRTIQVTISNANLNQNFVVLGLAFRYREYSPFAWPSTLKVFS